MKRNSLILLLTIALGAMTAQAQQKIVPIVELKVGGLIGGIQNGKFVNAKTTAAALKGGEKYELFSIMGHEEGEMTGQKAENDMDVCTDFYYLKLDPEAKSGVAIGQGIRWNPASRVAKSLSLTDATYKKIASDFLKKEGIANPVVKLTQVLRIDLEGDGVEEVIMTGTKYSGQVTSSAKPGDYSFALMRKVVNGKVVTTTFGADIIKKNVPFGAPNTWTISSLADLNGDGKIEVIVHWAYYEGSGSFVMEMQNGKAVEIKTLGAACGV